MIVDGLIFKMKNQRAQVAVFVIIAIVVLIAVVVLFFSKTNLENNSNISKDVRPVYSYVEDCIKEVGNEAVYYVGQSGGYFIVPEPSPDGNIPYYLYEGSNYMPSKERVSEELSLYMNFILPFCINDFEDFVDFEITSEDIQTQAIIDDEKVFFQVNYGLSIVKEDATYTLNDFEVGIPVRLGVMYDAIEEVMTEQMEEKTAVCISCLYDIGQRYDLDFHILDTNETESILFVARDEDLKIYDEDYLFYFMNKLEEELE